MSIYFQLYTAVSMVNVLVGALIHLGLRMGQ